MSRSLLSPRAVSKHLLEMIAVQKGNRSNHDYITGLYNRQKRTPPKTCVLIVGGVEFTNKILLDFEMRLVWGLLRTILMKYAFYVCFLFAHKYSQVSIKRASSLNSTEYC